MVPPKTDVGQTTASFSFRLEGESEVRAALLAQVLLGFSDSLFLLSKEYKEYEDSHLLVSAIRPGSVEIPFVAVMQMAQTVFPFVAQNASTIVTTLKGMLEIKKILKGNKPKSVSEDAGLVHVESPDGTQVTAPLGSRVVITNPRVDKAISSIGQASQLHNPSGGFWFLHGNTEEYFSSHDAQEIALAQPFAEMTDSRSSRSIRVTLPIKSPDLLGDASWQFRFANRIIQQKYLTLNICGQCIVGALPINREIRLMLNLRSKKSEHQLVRFLVSGTLFQRSTLT